jgi:hypothetical protein
MKNWQMTARQYLVQKYCYMRDRVTDPGRSIEGRHYFNISLCSQQEFINFGLRSKKFNDLFKIYKRSKGKRHLAPSVDRINPLHGYSLNNIQFLSLSKNVKKSRTDKWVVLENEETGRLHKFLSTTEASKFLGHLTRIKVSRASFISQKTGERFFNRIKN